MIQPRMICSQRLAAVALTLNDRRLRVSKRKELADCLIGTRLSLYQIRLSRCLHEYPARHDAANLRPAPPRLCRTRLGLHRRRTLRWLLRNRTQAVGHRRRLSVDYRSGRDWSATCKATTASSRRETSAQPIPKYSHRCCKYLHRI